MKRYLNRILPKGWHKPGRTCLAQWGLTALLGIAAWLFWQMLYPHALAYHEQFQLFLTTSSYLCERVAEPGGLSAWVAEFLTQFYNSALLGALVVALLLMAVQRQTWHLMQHGGAQGGTLYALSFVPSLTLWHAMGDVNVMLAFGVSLSVVLAFCRLTSLAARLVNTGWHRTVLLILVGLPGMALLYWIAGPLAILAALWMTLCLPWANPVNKKAVVIGLLALASVVLTMLLSAASQPYPVGRLTIGLFYYRLPLVIPIFFAVVPLLVLLLTALPLLLHRFSKKPVAVGRKKRRFSVATLATVAAVAALGIIAVPKGFDAKIYELLDYDYLVRTGQWQKVIAKAERQQPDLPMSVSATNLALAMQGQLGERAFDFYQRGIQGLLPPFERNFSTTMLTGEIYFQLGMVNTAQRLAFEAMESIPNYNKSVRAIRRLAETNMVNGQYEVARKYLDMLDHTLFYAKWAEGMRQLLYNDAKVTAHPLYGRLQKLRLQDDYLFSDREGDRMMGQLFLHDTNNTMAIQYLLLWPLLEGNMPKFMDYLKTVQNRTAYNPRSCQEAVAWTFAQNKQKPPTSLCSDAVAQRFLAFANIYNRQGKNSPQLNQFQNTLWYYLIGRVKSNE